MPLPYSKGSMTCSQVLAKSFITHSKQSRSHCRQPQYPQYSQYHVLASSPFAFWSFLIGLWLLIVGVLSVHYHVENEFDRLDNNFLIGLICIGIYWMILSACFLNIANMPKYLGVVIVFTFIALVSLVIVIMNRNTILSSNYQNDAILGSKSNSSLWFVVFVSVMMLYRLVDEYTYRF